MAITKIHPIKATLNLAIDYITGSEKTDEEVLISSKHCHPSTAHLIFRDTKEKSGTHATVLARHLIQSFLPGETTPEKAHEIGMELCKRVLKDEYEFVLATHVDRGHIHNHIIFNNVNKDTGKCYKSNKRSYHQIRYQSDKLCKENNLSVIDEHYEKFKRKYKTAGKSWYENEQHKKGTSWKSKLQFDIDRMIKQSKDWDEFLEKMANLGYEIKHGKHIAFRHKDKQRFTRSKTIGEDYTEERLKERIAEEPRFQTKLQKKPLEKVIDISNNEKAKFSKGYEIWARKHNLKAMANSVILLREHGIKSIAELDRLIQRRADIRQETTEKIKEIDTEMSHLSEMMEHAYTVTKYREIYKYHKENPNDKNFENEYSRELAVYKVAATEILKQYKKLPNTKELLAEIDGLQEKKNTLMKEYSKSKDMLNDLYLIRKNFDQYMGKEMER
jgi:hypothetical protein